MFVENFLIFNVVVHLKQVGNQFANGRRLKTRRKKILLPTSLVQKVFDAAAQTPADQN